jgi:Domain of unknown function (DUF4129)
LRNRPTRSSIPGPVMVLGTVGISAALYLAIGRPRWAKRLWRRLERTFHAGTRPALITSFYKEALELLAARGLTRARGQTPLEFARDLAGHPASDPFMALTRLYNRARFGASFEPEDAVTAEATLTSLRLALRGRSLKRDKAIADAGPI